MNNHITIYLDNIKVNHTDWQGGDFEVTKSFDKKLDYTTDIEFFGDAYLYLKEKLVDNRITATNMLVPTPTGTQITPVKTINTVLVKVYDNCCGTANLIFDGQVENLSFDDIRCSIKATLIENGIYKKIQNYYLNKSRVFDNKILEKVGYCTEPTPSFIHSAIILITFFVKIIVTNILILMRITLIFLEALDFLLGAIGIDVDLSPVEFIENVFQDINEFAFDCLKVHPVAYIKDYIQDIADQCGIEKVESEIYFSTSSPYSDTIMLQAEAKEGFRIDKNPNYKGFIPENEPLYGAYEFLDMICKPFNADWRVINKVLYIKHKSHWISGELLNLPSNVKIEEYNSNDNENPAYITVEFTMDSLDTVGNTAKNVWYKKLIDFNRPVANFQKGNKTFNIPFGMHRQVNDGVQDSTTWFWINDSIIAPLISLIFARSPSEVDKLLLLEKGLAVTPKLLIWDKNAKRIKDLNKAYHVKENGKNGELAKFFESENPRAVGFKFFSYNIQTDPLKCEEFAMYADSLGKRLRTSQGYAVINELKVNYTKRTIGFSGVI